MRRGRPTSHLFLSPAQAKIARSILDDINRVSYSLVPLLASGATKEQMAKRLGWAIPSVSFQIRRFRNYTKELGSRSELQRRLIA